MTTEKAHFLDGGKARGLAILIAAVAAAALGWINREAFWGDDEATSYAGNPELAACLTERVGAVDTMRSEGIISDAQFTTFKTRTVDYCHAQFPESEVR